MRPGAETWARWTLVGVCLGGALSVAFGAAPSWLIPVALTAAALIALPEIVDGPRTRRLWTIAISAGCILATWLLRPSPRPTQQHLFTVWLWFWVASIGLLVVLSAVGWVHGKRDRRPDLDLSKPLGYWDCRREGPKAVNAIGQLGQVIAKDLNGFARKAQYHIDHAAAVRGNAFREWRRCAAAATDLTSLAKALESKAEQLDVAAHIASESYVVIAGWEELKTSAEISSTREAIQSAAVFLVAIRETIRGFEAFRTTAAAIRGYKNRGYTQALNMALDRGAAVVDLAIASLGKLEPALEEAMATWRRKIGAVEPS